MSDKDLEVLKQTGLATQQDLPMGFEDENEGDMIIPRVKVIQTLSPECKDRSAEEGDIINSLTKEKINGETFVPIFMFKNNIKWRPRSEGGGIDCIARDGKHGECSDGTNKKCAACRQNEFDNTKQGKEALPKCTKYINFFGKMINQPIPLILSFAKTNYNEGKKMYSLAKVTMQNMWHYGYTLNEKKVAKNGNEWFIIQPAPAGAVSDEERELGLQMFKTFRASSLNYDVAEDVSDSSTDVGASKEELDSTEF